MSIIHDLSPITSQQVPVSSASPLPTYTQHSAYSSISPPPQRINFCSLLVEHVKALVNAIWQFIARLCCCKTTHSPSSAPYMPYSPGTAPSAPYSPAPFAPYPFATAPHFNRPVVHSSATTAPHLTPAAAYTPPADFFQRIQTLAEPLFKGCFRSNEPGSSLFFGVDSSESYFGIMHLRCRGPDDQEWRSSYLFCNKDDFEDSIKNFTSVAKCAPNHSFTFCIAFAQKITKWSFYEAQCTAYLADVPPHVLEPCRAMTREGLDSLINGLNGNDQQSIRQVLSS
jgi:hypothetical protein